MSSDVIDDLPSLKDRFAALAAERKATWSPEALAINQNQRTLLVHEHGLKPHIAAGDIVPPAVLTTTDGSPLTLDELVVDGRAVLIFFRFAGCPTCNIALPYYRDTLWPALQHEGIPLVAISPQPIEPLAAIVSRHALPFPVASDSGLALARALGITYVFDDASREAAIAKGGRSEDINGTSVWELPKPAVIIIDRGRVVRFAELSPDWTERTESSVILSALGLPAQQDLLNA